MTTLCEHNLNEIDAALLADQLSLEARMATAGTESFWKSLEGARAGGRESETCYGTILLKSGIAGTVAKLQEFLALASSGRAGPKHAAHKYLIQTEPEVAAFLGLKVVIDQLSGPDSPVTRTAITIGTRFNDEVRFRRFKKEYPAEFKRLAMKLDKAERQDRDYKRVVMRLIAGREGVTDIELWPENHRFMIGKAVLDAIREGTGIIDYHYNQGIAKARANSAWEIRATERTLAWVKATCANMEAHMTRYWPMIAPPKPWTTPGSGGYWSPWAAMPLVKTRNKAYLAELAQRDMGRVYSAVNAMQGTPWRVNKAVLATLKVCIERGLEVAGLPPAEDIPLPPKSTEIASSEEYVNGLRARVRAGDGTAQAELDAWKSAHGETLRAWKREANRVYEENRRLTSKRLFVLRLLGMAQDFAEYPAIYFPHQLDFRGRAYPVPGILNPQGSDVVKGLLTFAEGKPIYNDDDQGGFFWLAVHGANVYGYDKARLEDRAAWIEAHTPQVEAVVRDPFGDAFEFWTKADKPWQFLAFCYEWTAALAQGDGYVSTLPVAMDGTCNGLQHYSAALRDPVGGAAVNLTPAPTPSDIYREVAEVAMDKVIDFLCPGCSPVGTDGWWAAKWLEFGIDRKITKRSVMTLPYAATHFASRGFIEDAIREAIKGGKPNPFAHTRTVEGRDGEEAREFETDGIFEASLWLQGIVWEAIGEVVKAAKEAMEFLATCAREIAREGLPVNWTLSDGFLVQQDYREMKSRRIETIIDGKVFRPRIQGETDKIDVRKMGSGVAPNFVHSLDGLALRNYVNLAASNGMRHFGLVHDSYATLAADVSLMQSAIREAFVQVYIDTDPLADFHNAVASLVSRPDKLPPVPMKGDLDLELVKESDFFFA